MNRETAMAWCLEQNGAWEDRPFGPEALVAKVGSKMFAIVGGSAPAQLSVKCDPETAFLLRQQYEAIGPGYHLNKRHWNTILLDGTVPEQELRWMIEHSYALVVRSLTKREREQLSPAP